MKSFGTFVAVSVLLVDCERPHRLIWAIGSTDMDVDGAEEITQEGDRTIVH